MGHCGLNAGRDILCILEENGRLKMLKFLSLGKKDRKCSDKIRWLSMRTSCSVVLCDGHI